MDKRKVIIIGAGPGGLASAMLLSRYGFDVTIYEQKPYVGGRNAHIQLGDYKFDIGPTFFLMRSVLDEIFEACGRKLEDYVKLFNLDPMYRLSYSNDREFFPSLDREKMRSEMERLWPGSFKGYEKYLEKEKIKYDKLIPCLQMPYSSIKDFFKWQFISSLPKLDAHKTLYSQLQNYFKGQDLITSFAFQAKYIGMSPWKAPGIFSIISYIEHGEGVFHVEGGLNELSKAMAKVVEEQGGSIKLEAPVKEVLFEGRKAVGVQMEDGTEHRADYVIVNEDFGHAVQKRYGQGRLKKWTPEKLEKKLFSCSTFMLYLGVDKLYENIPHHNICFAEDYKNNVEEISETYKISEDPSFYIQNASLTDKTLAPDGKSTIYVLVPIANQNSSIDWQKEKGRYRDKIMDLLETRGGLKGLRDHIEEELIITPDEWVDTYSVYKGAVFNLGHNISQMLIFRPHNQFEEFKNCYLVGGGTHPGSGLPTIYESGRITAKLIRDRAAKDS